MATSQRVDTSGIVTLQDQKLDASNVATRLWIGGRPPFDRDLPGFTSVQLRMLQQAAITACQQFSAAGRPIEYLRSMVIPGESRCMCLFAAPDLALVQAVNDAAQLPFTRIVEALDLSP